MKITIKTLRGRSRNAIVNDMRQVWMYFLRHTAGMTYEEIGRTVNRNHATALHGVRRVEQMLSIGDNRICAIVEAVKDDFEKLYP